MTSGLPLASCFRSFSRSGGLAAAGLGALGLIRSIVDAAALKSVVPGLAPGRMTPRTALCFVLVGLALLFSEAGPRRVRVAP